MRSTSSAEVAEQIRPHLYGSRHWYLCFAGFYGLSGLLNVGFAGLSLATGDWVAAGVQGASLLVTAVAILLLGWMWSTARALRIDLEGEALEQAILRHLDAVCWLWRVVGGLAIIGMALFALFVAGSVGMGMMMR